MKQVINVTVMAAIALLVFASGTLKGDTVPLTLNMQATATVQGPSTTVGDVTTYTTTTVKITNQSLFYLIAQALSKTFPANSKLVLENDGHIWVTDNSGNKLEDVSSDTILSLTFPPARNPDIVALNGQDNSSTGALKATDTYITMLHFDDGGDDSFDCQGFTVEKFSMSAVNNGTQPASDSLTITGCGEGYFGGDDAVLSGKLTGKGTTIFSSP